MKQFLFTLFTTCLTCTFFIANSKPNDIGNLDIKSRFAFLKEFAVSHFLSTKSTKFINSIDTSHPGNKNKSTTAQDYNSTGSNKANCFIIINVGNHPDRNDSVPVKLYAQDFNTTRSNRQNSNYSQKIGTGNMTCPEIG